MYSSYLPTTSGYISGTSSNTNTSKRDSLDDFGRKEYCTHIRQKYSNYASAVGDDDEQGRELNEITKDNSGGARLSTSKLETDIQRDGAFNQPSSYPIIDSILSKNSENLELKQKLQHYKEVNEKLTQSEHRLFIQVNDLVKEKSDLEKKLESYENTIYKIHSEIGNINFQISLKVEEKQSTFTSLWNNFYKLFQNNDYGTTDVKDIAKECKKILEYIKLAQVSYCEQDKALHSLKDKLTNLQKIKTNIEKEKDKEIKELRNTVSRAFKELKEKAELVIKYEKDLGEKDLALTQLNGRYIMECEENQKLEDHLDKLKKEHLALKGQLEKAESNVRLMKINVEIAQSQIKEMSLKEAREADAILKEEERLINEREDFEACLENISKIVTEFSKQILLQDVESFAENKFIMQALKNIDDVKVDVQSYEKQIDEFKGSREDKAFLHMKEMLVRALEKLDAIDSRDKIEIRDKKRSAIAYIQGLQNKLSNSLSSRF